MKWLRRLFRRVNACLARSPGATLSPLATIPVAPDWTALDRDKWRGVLDSELGRKLLARGRAVHYLMLDAASKDHFHAAQNVHAARGFNEAIRWLQSLSLSASASAEQSTGTPGEASSSETPAEMEARESAAFLQRMSP